MKEGASAYGVHHNVRRISYFRTDMSESYGLFVNSLNDVWDQALQ